MLATRFDNVNGGLTPQEQLNYYVSLSAEGTSQFKDSKLQSGRALDSVAKNFSTYLYGDEKATPVIIGDQLVVMAVMELADIKKAADSACPNAHMKALNDIHTHGSLSSARLASARTNFQAAPTESYQALDI